MTGASQDRQARRVTGRRQEYWAGPVERSRADFKSLVPLVSTEPVARVNVALLLVFSREHKDF